MANSTIKNLLFLLHKRYLVTSSKLPPLPPPLPEINKASNFALHFLTNSCGLPLKSAISVSLKFQLQEKNEKKLQSVINYLKDEGFTQTHIAKLIQKLPKVLHSNVDTILKPKLEFLKQNGFVGEFLIEILVKDPDLLQASLGSKMKPALELLRSYLGSDEKIVFAIRRCSWVLSKKVLQPNIEFLVNESVPVSSIAKILILHPRAIAQKHSTTIYAVNSVKRLGFQPSSPMFVHAFRVMISNSESTWKKKVEFLQSFGWSEEDILSAFKRFPQMMACSEGRIRKSIDFYLNTVKLDLQTIITNPVLLSYAIDTRVRPRFIVLKILESKKLIKENRMTFSWIILSNKIFLDNYVMKYEDNVPGLLDIYGAGKRAGKMGTLMA